MSTVSPKKARQAEIPPPAHQPPSPVVEVPLLLEAYLLAGLEAAARARGLSTAALVRRLVGDFLTGHNGGCQARRG
jgi:hypothetical protein